MTRSEWSDLTVCNFTLLLTEPRSCSYLQLYPLRSRDQRINTSRRKAVQYDHHLAEVTLAPSLISCEALKQTELNNRVDRQVGIMSCIPCLSFNLVSAEAYIVPA